MWSSLLLSLTQTKCVGRPRFQPINLLHECIPWGKGKDHFTASIRPHSFLLFLGFYSELSTIYSFRLNSKFGLCTDPLLIYHSQRVWAAHLLLSRSQSWTKLLSSLMVLFKVNKGETLCTEEGQQVSSD